MQKRGGRLRRQEEHMDIDCREQLIRSALQLIFAEHGINAITKWLNAGTEAEGERGYRNYLNMS